MKLGQFFNLCWHKVVAWTQPRTSTPPTGGAEPASGAESSPEFSDDEVKALVMGLAQTEARELSCDEVFALLDIFAERVQRGDDAVAMMPLVQHHLAMCPDCREEYEALLKSMQATATHE